MHFRMSIKMNLTIFKYINQQFRKIVPGKKLRISYFRILTSTVGNFASMRHRDVAKK